MTGALSVAGLILAAGESRRMGFPKALLRYREETFLDRLVGLFAARCSPVIVVLGAEADRIRAGAGHGERSPATFVVNPDYARGQTTSMQCGLRAVPGGADGVLFTLVDHPAVAPATIDALLAGGADDRFVSSAWPRAWQTTKNDGLPHHGIPLIRVPRYHGRRGHPIWFSRELVPEFLALPETGAARDVVRGHAAQTEFLDVDDPGILADIDDPEAYRGLTGAGA